ncbi:hypothetical protein [Nibribacter koreensis]|uniref:Uncharacterized protein n=1 Tax=Nibribacter koreensis TaxID=1084519 RepID=A0ABP8G2Y1_9BACT
MSSDWEVMHQSYEELFYRKPDFRVTYTIFTEEEGGRKTPPFQGIRWDFKYDHPEHSNGAIFMIWPEFEDAQGDLIKVANMPLPRYGQARMWIIIEERRAYHKEKIKIGTHGYFMEGHRKVGECEVIELLSLK